MSVEMFEKYDTALSGYGGVAAGVMVGVLIRGMLESGMEPAEVGEVFRLMACAQLEIKGSPEAARFETATDQLVSRSRDALGLQEGEEGNDGP